MKENNGYIERSKGGYVGELNIDGVDISPVVGVYFKDNGTHWLWLKRKKILEYSFETESYKTREPKPLFETYLRKQKPTDDIAYKGEFVFFKFKYSIYGIWDKQDNKKDRLNLFVERLPMGKQDILNKLNTIKNDK